MRTAFNLLGPLTNPAGATRQLVGVPRPEFTELLARALMLLGSERAWVVHGADGIDEISTTGYTKVSECRDGAVNTFYLHPADVGLPKAAPGALQGGDAHENARIIERVLDGERGPARDVVLLNAGAALFIAGAAASVDDGILQASRAIDRGDAQRTLEQLVSISTAEESPAGAAHDDVAAAADLLGDDRRRDAAHRRGARRSASRCAALARRAEARTPRPGVSRRRWRGPIASTSSPSASGGRRRAGCCAPTTIRWRSRAATRRPARRRSRC